MIFEGHGPGFTEEEEALEVEAGLEADALSTQRLFQKLDRRDPSDIRMTSLYRVLWALPSLTGSTEQGLQYIGRTILIRCAGFQCGPNVGPMPVLYEELLEAAKTDPICTFLLRLSAIPNEEVGVMGLNVLLQVLPYDQKHMRMGERADFCARVAASIQVQTHDNDYMLPLLLLSRELSVDSLMVPWYRKHLIQMALPILQMLVAEERDVTRTEAEEKVVATLSAKGTRKVPGWQKEDGVRRLFASIERARDAACLLCESLGNIITDPMADEMLSTDAVTLMFLFQTTESETRSDVLALAFFDLLWQLSAARRCQNTIQKMVQAADTKVYRLLLSHVECSVFENRAEADGHTGLICRKKYFTLQAAGVLWNCFRTHEAVMYFQSMFESSADDDSGDDSTNLLLRLAVLITSVERNLADAQDLVDILVVACGLCAELLSTDFNVFYMSQQHGLMDTLVRLSTVSNGADRKAHLVARQASRALAAARK